MKRLKNWMPLITVISTVVSVLLGVKLLLMNPIEARIDRMGARFDQVETRMRRIETVIAAIQKHLNKNDLQIELVIDHLFKNLTFRGKEKK